MRSFGDSVRGSACIIVSDKGQLPCVENAIRRYEAVVREYVNLEKSGGLQFGTWREKSMPSNSVVGRWKDGLVKLLGM